MGGDSGGVTGEGRWRWKAPDIEGRTGRSRAAWALWARPTTWLSVDGACVGPGGRRTRLAEVEGSDGGGGGGCEDGGGSEDGGGRGRRGGCAGGGGGKGG